MTDLQYTCSLLRSGVEITQLQPDSPPSVSMTSAAEIKMTATGSFIEPHDVKINYATDRMQITVSAGSQPFSLGVYIIATAQRKKDQYKTVVSITGYDNTYLIKRSKTETRLHLKAGTKYTDAVRTLLVDSGIQDILMTSSDLTLSTDREDWEPGTDRLTICNILLSEINYRSIYADLNGVVCVVPAEEPSPDKVTKTYRAGQYSILYPDITTDLDYFDRPNVWIRYVENPENQIMRAMAENMSPTSPFSVPNIGQRIVDIQKLNNIADQKTLQAYVDNLKSENLMASNKVTFRTLVAPHGVHEIVALDAGVYTETGWSVDLAAPMAMTHKGQEVISIAP